MSPEEIRLRCLEHAIAVVGLMRAVDETAPVRTASLYADWVLLGIVPAKPEVVRPGNAAVAVNGPGDLEDKIKDICAIRRDRFASLQAKDKINIVRNQAFPGESSGGRVESHNESPAGCVEAPSLSQGGRIGNDSAAQPADAREGV